MRWLPLAAIVAVTVTGCGDDGGGAATASSENGPAKSAPIVEEARAGVERLRRSPGSYHEPEVTSAKPAAGKRVWLISLGNENQPAAEASKAVVEGARTLGWNAKVYDGKFNPSNWLAGVRQAVQQKADAIIIAYFDCAPAKQGFVEAKRAGIPVIAMGGFDCNELGRGGPKLFTHTVGYSEGGFEQWQRQWGKTQAEYTIAATGGKAKILFMRETDVLATVVIAEEYEKQIAKCPDCEIVEKIDFVATDLGPPLQAKVQQALLKHPDASVVYANYDAPVVSAVAPAVRAAGKKPLVIGGEGDLPNLDLIGSGQQAMAVGYIHQWETYAALDALVSIFAGEKPVQDSGIGVLLVDKEHNLPAKGQRTTVPFDWKAAYLKAWGAAG